jgi:hypothetical protein
MILALATMATSAATAQQPGPQPGQLTRPIAREPRAIAPAVLVATITVTPAVDTVDPGGCRQFTATAFDAANRPVGVPSFRFSVSDPARFQADEFGGGVCATAGGPAATTQVTAGFPNSTITGSAALTVRATPPAPRVPLSSGGSRVVAPPRSPELTAVPPPPSVLATTPVTGFAATAPRPFTVELSWQHLLGATGYLIWRDGQVVTMPQPVRAGTTFTDVNVTPGSRGYAIAALFRRADGSEGLTEPRYLSTTSVVARGLPKPAQPWLARPGGAGSEAAAQAYQRSWGRERGDLEAWKRANRFEERSVARAVYFNAGDLAFGRDMHCAAYGGGSDGRDVLDVPYTIALPSLACYVSNHGPRPGQAGFPNTRGAIADAISQHQPFATVAMELWGGSAGQRGHVRFFAFGEDGRAVTRVVLDGEGPKFLPDACLSCHGGRYDPITQVVEDAAFLPFDVHSFEFSETDPRYSLAAQDAAFRRLNDMVAQTRGAAWRYPNDLIADFIAGLSQHGADYVPASWSKAPALYRDVVRPYCRTCHLAVRPDVISSSDAFLSFKPRLELTLCGLFTMPHAEVPYKKFWTSTNPSAPAVFASALNVKCGG